MQSTRKYNDKTIAIWRVFKNNPKFTIHQDEIIVATGLTRQQVSDSMRTLVANDWVFRRGLILWQLNPAYADLELRPGRADYTPYVESDQVLPIPADTHQPAMPDITPDLEVIIGLLREMIEKLKAVN